MAREGSGASIPAGNQERIVDVDVSEEMRGSFLEYAYSVIYSRALPDARDGLKPVQRRILFQMAEMGLRPDRGHVKSARVVGEVMGKLHPHGDSAIYDALVRMSQSFTLRLPMIDGHGNFGSADDGPAAMRYTECRLAPPALDMTSSLDEDVVDFAANYDGRETEPTVLPAALPNLLVNGASGIAVGMATNMAPHNLGEVVAAARHLLEYPNARLDTLMRLLPGPDLPTGGVVVGLDGIREAYETGRGRFRIRATTHIEKVSARRQGIVVTSLPHTVGPERVSSRIKELVLNKKITGIANLVDLTDADHGLRLIIEIKSGYNPEAIRSQLFKMTPMEEQFSINNVALVDGTPRTLGLKELLKVYLEHRVDVVRRRSLFRKRRAEERLHLVEGLLAAILDIDEVIAIIRGSDDAAQARHRLVAAFGLSRLQVDYILEMPLRRLTKFSRLELETESEELGDRIRDLALILADESQLRKVVSGELADVASRHVDPRRTVLLESDGEVSATLPLEVVDNPCWVLLSNSGLLARTSSPGLPTELGADTSNACVVAGAPTTARGHIGLVGSDGILRKLSVLELPTLANADSLTVSGGTPLGALVDLPRAVQPVGIIPLSETDVGLVAVGTARGSVKRLDATGPASKDEWEIIRLADGDKVVGVARTTSADDDFVFITRSAQLLHFKAESVRPQGRAAGGMVGIKLRDRDTVVAFAVLDPENENAVVTIAGETGALPGTEARSGKVTRFSAYPAKGRATGGVRCHRMRAGEDELALAWAGRHPASAADSTGASLPLPATNEKRDAPGEPVATSFAAIGGLPR
jgi:DNA gyrase subunit A